MGWLSGLGGIVGGIGGFVSGGIGGAISGFHTGEQLLGGGGGATQNSSPRLPMLGSGGPQGGTGVVPYGSGVNQGPFIGIPGMFGGPSSPGTQLAVRPHGHYTKGTSKNPSHWSNRRRPRMNPMNVHAGRRAITRIRAAEKLFHRFLSVSHPGHTGHVKPKRIARR